ncbi:hypothetical protein BDV93DRAFT_513848 [Ceratobasidium sp. AG-I]|nr:hypothetical protein BDV93DRAFT_513848 [Ceratobasidium sp. AG-I]
MSPSHSILASRRSKTGCSRSRPLSTASVAHIAPKRQALTNFDKLRIMDIYHKHKNYLSQQAIVNLLRKEGYSTISQPTISRLAKEESTIRAHVVANPRRLYYK